MNYEFSNIVIEFLIIKIKQKEMTRNTSKISRCLTSFDMTEKSSGRGGGSTIVAASRHNRTSFFLSQSERSSRMKRSEMRELIKKTLRHYLEGMTI